MKNVETIYWKNGNIVMIDQRILPHEIVYNTYDNYKDVAMAIKVMVIRGAPAIGVATAMGIAQGMNASKAKTIKQFVKEFEKIATVFKKTRPTAVNLAWAVDRMRKCLIANNGLSISEIKDILIKEAIDVYTEDIEINKSIGKFGAALLKKKSVLLTHCNAGALATAGYGTALGVIRAAYEKKKIKNVFADETRPFLQGARLTAWELQQEGIPVTLITDNMAGYFMAKGMIDAVVVGADRIASNGDAANKIGTYGLSVLAHENKIPFYVAAPTSTIDMNIASGDEIPIEERPYEEVTDIGGKRIAPHGIKIANPAFDVSPAKYITAIITEKGAVTKPYKANIRKIFK